MRYPLPTICYNETMKWNKEYLQSLVDKYPLTEEEVTYSGFLYYADLTNDKLTELRNDCTRGDADAIECMRILDRFKLGLEAYMERVMLYQRKRMDYKTIGNMWVASKSRGVFDANRDMRVSAMCDRELPRLQDNESGFKIDNVIAEITKRV